MWVCNQVEVPTGLLEQNTRTHTHTHMQMQTYAYTHACTHTHITAYTSSLARSSMSHLPVLMKKHETTDKRFHQGRNCKLFYMRRKYAEEMLAILPMKQCVCVIYLFFTQTVFTTRPWRTSARIL